MRRFQSIVKCPMRMPTLPLNNKRFVAQAMASALMNHHAYVEKNAKEKSDRINAWLKHISSNSLSMSMKTQNNINDGRNHTAITFNMLLGEKNTFVGIPNFETIAMNHLQEGDADGYELIVEQTESIFSGQILTGVVRFDDAK